MKLLFIVFTAMITIAIPRPNHAMPVAFTGSNMDQAAISAMTSRDFTSSVAAPSSQALAHDNLNQGLVQASVFSVPSFMTGRHSGEVGALSSLRSRYHSHSSPGLLDKSSTPQFQDLLAMFILGLIMLSLGRLRKKIAPSE
jgi:hypothetical protein